MAAALCSTRTAPYRHHFLPAAIPTVMKWRLTVDLEGSALSFLPPSCPHPSSDCVDLTLLLPHPPPKSVLLRPLQLNLAGETPTCTCCSNLPPPKLWHPILDALSVSAPARSLSRHCFPTRVPNPLSLLSTGLHRPPAVGLQTEQAPHRVGVRLASILHSMASTQFLDPPSWPSSLGGPKTPVWTSIS